MDGRSELRYPWAKLSAIVANQAGEGAVTVPPAPEDGSSALRLKGIAMTLRRTVIAGEYERAARLIAHEARRGAIDRHHADTCVVAIHMYAARQCGSESTRRRLGEALRHVQRALTHAVAADPPVLHPRTVERMSSVSALYDGDAVQAFSLYPKSVPPAISEERWRIERAVIALRAGVLDEDLLEPLRYDLLIVDESELFAQEPEGHLVCLRAQAIAACYWRRRMWPEVVYWLNRADTGREPASSLALAYAAYQLGENVIATDSARAVSLWRWAAELGVDQEIARIAAIRCMEVGRAQAFRAWGAGDSEGVVRFAAAVVDLAQGRAEIEFLYLLLEAYIRLERFEEGLAVTEMLLDRHPGNLLGQLLNGLLMLASAAPREAQEYLETLAYDTPHPSVAQAMDLASQAQEWEGDDLPRHIQKPLRAFIDRALDELIHRLLLEIEQEQQVERRVPRERPAPLIESMEYEGPSLPPLAWWIVTESVVSEALTTLLSESD